MRTAIPSALFASLLHVPGLVAAPLTVTSDTNLPEDTIAAYDSISISNGATLTLGGGSVITVSGAVTVSGNSFIVFAGKNVDAQVGGEWQGEGSSLFASTVTVDAGSAIHADGQGYLTGLGPGGPGAGANTKGASYGGLGWVPTNTEAKPVYGLMTQPVDLGSAGGAYLTSTTGGGAIRLDVSGTLTVGGVISADGTTAGGNHSGATGGSIWITTDILVGAGVIRANASAGGTGGGNKDSAGGRVAVYYKDATGFTDLSKIEAKATGEAQDGTVYLVEQSPTGEHLTVFHRMVVGTGLSAEFASLQIDGGLVEMRPGAVLKVADTLSVINASRILLDWAQVGGRIETGNLSVAAGTSISADGSGYGPGEWIGGPAANANNTGAGHGGDGGGSGPNEEYGDPLEPTTAGSAGGIYLSSTHGGGLSVSWLTIR